VGICEALCDNACKKDYTNSIQFDDLNLQRSSSMLHSISLVLIISQNGQKIDVRLQFIK